MSPSDHADFDFIDEEPNPNERRSFILFVLILLIPVMGALGVGFYQKFSEDTPFTAGKGHPLTDAASWIAAYSRQNPPQGNWLAKGVRIVGDKTMVLDVELPSLQHATAISTRRPRIQYSYVKLACPPDDAGHKPMMEEHDRIIVALRYQGKLIAEGTCPHG